MVIKMILHLKPGLTIRIDPLIHNVPICKSPETDWRNSPLNPFYFFATQRLLFKQSSMKLPLPFAISKRVSFYVQLSWVQSAKSGINLNQNHWQSSWIMEFRTPKGRIELRVVRWKRSCSIPIGEIPIKWSKLEAHQSFMSLVYDIVNREHKGHISVEHEPRFGPKVDFRASGEPVVDQKHIYYPSCKEIIFKVPKGTQK